MAYSEAGKSNDNSNAGALVEANNRKKKVVVLGTGWAGTSFLKNLKDPSYDVQVISPRNYFAFTPLLPSVTCGTVESRSVVEPIRNIIRKVGNSNFFIIAFCLFHFDSSIKSLYKHLHIIVPLDKPTLKHNLFIQPCGHSTNIIIPFDFSIHIMIIKAKLLKYHVSSDIKFTSSLQRYAEAYYWEAECIKIDPENKKVYCRSNLSTNGNGKEEFAVDYDYLVIATGARVNTFNIPGVEENTFFLKVIPVIPSASL